MAGGRGGGEIRMNKRKGGRDEREGCVKGKEGGI